MNMLTPPTTKLTAYLVVATFTIIAFLPSAAAKNSQNSYEFCGDSLSRNAFDRPLDYRDPANAFYLEVIENAHFTRDVELLIRGNTGESPVYDLAYVLRQMPNHYRALIAMSKLQEKKKFNLDLGRGRTAYTTDCYFRRALIFTADDPVIHHIYAIHLHKSGDLDSALSEYSTAKQIGPPSAELHYNLGLLYVDRKEYDAARREAKRAYELGYPLDGLRAKLDRVGEWHAH